MKEYEYSFKVKSIKPFINYCEMNGYEKISVTTQNRMVYENKNCSTIIARITTTTSDNKTKTVFDCKNVGMVHIDLKISNESLPLRVTNRNKKNILSILETLDFYLAANNYRTRYVYIKDNVKFEIDDYVEPQMQVVGIEGEKESVDAVYLKVKDL